MHHLEDDTFEIVCDSGQGERTRKISFGWTIINTKQKTITVKWEYLKSPLIAPNIFETIGAIYAIASTITSITIQKPLIKIYLDNITSIRCINQQQDFRVKNEITEQIEKLISVIHDCAEIEAISIREGDNIHYDLHKLCHHVAYFAHTIRGKINQGEKNYRKAQSMRDKTENLHCYLEEINRKYNTYSLLT